ncbi:histidine kinase [Streptomyces sp. TRM64462]|uniref:sensor histidine kinase n=1 Tax=Streptomyces sp. TRM64462 TaxID=2741726 RepID=UPI0015863E67|nr:histidine kinase [Streptomyces sp. TRM64462]
MVVLVRAKSKCRALRESARNATFQERLRIASELHDGAGHRMLAIVLHARQLRAQDGGTHAPRTAHLIEELAVEAQREVREALGCLPVPGSAPADPPLSERVVALGEGLPPDVDLTVRFGNAEAESGLGAAVRHAAYRIVQEALSNAVKHGSGPVDVRVDFGERLRVTVTNAARREEGATPVFPGSGQGLAHMRRRAAELGGHVTYRPLPDGGVRLTAVL